MRRAARIDANQPEIIRALMSVGAGVQSLAGIGCGCPDLLVTYGGQNHLLEVKDGAKPPSDRELTRDEKRWHAFWRLRGGAVHVVLDAAEALEAIGARVVGPVQPDGTVAVFADNPPPQKERR